MLLVVSLVVVSLSVKVGAIPSIKMALDKGAKSVVLMSGVASEFKQ